MSDNETDGLPVQPEVQQARGRKASSAGAKVTVACNLPAGIRLRTFRMVTVNELVMGGGSREVRIAEPVGEPILINGVATHFGMAPRCEIVAGYALTRGVDKESWDAWLADNQASPMVKNRCIFAYENDAKAIDAAKDAKGTLSGLEPFKKKDDPRRPRRPNNDALSEVVEDDSRAAA